MISKQCPICDKDVPARMKDDAHPFCSERCQLADLGKWLDGDYAIGGDPSPMFDD